MEELRLRASLELGLAESNLVGRLLEFVEEDGNFWYQARGIYSDEELTWFSALLALRVFEEVPLPRIIEVVPRTRRFQELQVRLDKIASDSRTLGRYKEILKEIFEMVPVPASLDTTLGIVDLVHGHSAPPRFSAILTLLGAVHQLLLPSGEIDAHEAAIRVQQGDSSFIQELIDARVLPDCLEVLARQAGRRSSTGRPSTAPIERFARLPGEAGALFVYGSPLRLPSWASVSAVMSHLARLAEVCQFSQPETLYPSIQMLGEVKIDKEVAMGYDQLLLEDARLMLSELLEGDVLSEATATHRAFKHAMAGFRPFISYLQRAASQGAQISAYPKGLADTSRASQLYSSCRSDLCPPPDTFRLLLGLLPVLLEGEDDRLSRLLIIQFVTAARASVVLALDKSCWIQDAFGVLLHVRYEGNKTGRSVLFLAQPWIDLFDIRVSWLPDVAEADPPEAQRRRLSELIDRVCTKFEGLTGLAVERQSTRFSRSSMVQLLRIHLRGEEREVITALLGHRSRVTRANYWRAWQAEVVDAYSSFGETFELQLGATRDRQSGGRSADG
ncbi:hypothetical protein [Ferrimicrobium sp.]|uniref:hypothetical protein n=1 Tax=Ferrimicrobium sp. TaxID=2926050 RepID=UPI0026133B28|nr:hypothetical protein [Ferrimicrobium sp.]